MTLWSCRQWREEESHGGGEGERGVHGDGGSEKVRGCGGESGRVRGRGKRERKKRSKKLGLGSRVFFVVKK